MYRCCVCGQRLAGTSWLCNKCAQGWGLLDVPVRDWPDWAKLCKRAEQHTRSLAHNEDGWVNVSESFEAETKVYGEWNRDPWGDNHR